jgi:predicted acylesterase/phospholipase RssA
VRGLFTSALADNAPLASIVERVVTDKIVCEIAAEHRKGRRLYVGTTELEGHRFVFWDLGEIANRGTPGDRELIHKILLGSSAIPGFFPPSKIPVSVDGKPFYELHADGGVSQAIFFRPPYVPAAERNEATRDLAGTDLYMVVAGKLYADAKPQKTRSLALAGSSVSGVLYAQARGDLQRLYLTAMLTGMNYQLCSIPGDFPAPTSSATFKKKEMTEMFDEGVRLAKSGEMWRQSPPGVAAGESQLKRGGTALTEIVRGPGLVVPKRGRPINPLSDGRLSIPVTSDALVK